MRRGLSPFRTNRGGKDAVAIALRHRHVDVAEAVVAIATCPPGPDASLALDIQAAVVWGSAPLTRALLAIGAPHDPQIDANTPLLGLAVDRGHTAIVDELLRHGGSDFRFDTLGEALILAAQGGRAAIVRALLLAGAAIAWCGTGGRTPLMQAALGGHVEVVRALFARGAADELRDDEGWLAVHLAAHQHHTGVLEAIAAARGSLDAPGRADMRPLSIAVCSAHPGVWAQTSLAWDEQGVRAEAVTVATELDRAVLATVRLLLGRGVAVDARDANGHTALHHAVIHVQPGLIAELLAHGARADAPDSAGETPLEIARAAAALPDVSPLVALRIAAVVQLLEAAAA